MNFLIDSQLPAILTGWIRERGHDADHVRGFALQRTNDDTIWQLALARRATIITRDKDFADWALSRSPAPQVVWIRIGNATNLSLTARLESAWDRIISELESGARVVEIGRQ